LSTTYEYNGYAKKTDKPKNTNDSPKHANDSIRLFRVSVVLDFVVLYFLVLPS